MRTRIAAIGIVLLTLMLVTTGTWAQDENLVINGGFEAPVVTDPAGWNVYPSGIIPGWQVVWASAYPGAPSVPTSSYRIRRTCLVGAHSGEQMPELDSGSQPRWTAGGRSGLDTHLPGH